MTRQRGLDWIWKSLVASFCGTLAHVGLMELKNRTGLLPGFDPSAALRTALTFFLAGAIPFKLAPWILSQLNGAIIISLLFGASFTISQAVVA
jgi:hypothetical protein